MEPTIDGDSAHRFRLCHFVFPGYRESTLSWKSACAIVSAPVMSELTSTMVVREQIGTSKASTETGSDACCTRVSRSSSLIEGSSESVIFFWKSTGTPPGYREVFTYIPSSDDGAVARTLRSIGAAGPSATLTRVDLLSRCHTII